MKRIIQLTDEEYQEIFELATLNQESIEEKAKDLWKKEGIATIKIDASVSGEYYSNYKINCRSYVYVKDGIFHMNRELKDKFDEYVNKTFKKILVGEYGKGIDLQKEYELKLERLDLVKREMNIVAFSGWGAFIGCLIYLIFG